MSKSMNNMRNICNISLKLLAFGSILAFANSAQAEDDVCWKNSSGRYVGTPPNVCPANWTASLVGTCNNNCPAGWRDDGLFCKKPGGYSRGTLWFSKTNCENANKDVGGCEWSWGALYPKCKPGFVAHVATECSPVCPDGMHDIGISCTKKTTQAQCPADKPVYDAGLCYKNCGAGEKGIGPVCWTQCPAGMIDCGAMCGKSVTACLVSIGDMIYSIADVAVKIVKTIATLGASVGTDAAAMAAKKAALESFKATAKDVAKNIVKKLGTEAFGPVKTAVAAELLKMNVPSFLADKLAEMAAAPDKFDYLAFIAGVDITGLTNIVVAFKKPICGQK